MIKKIFKHILIISLVFLPFLSHAKIEGITLSYPNDNENNAGGVKVYSTITQSPDTGQDKPTRKIQAGFFIVKKELLSNGNTGYISCNDLPNNNSLNTITHTREKIEENKTYYIYDINYTYGLIESGETYYYCVRAEEGSNKYSSIVQEFTVKPNIKFFTANPTSVSIGGNTIVSWQTSGASNCKANSDNNTSWSGNIPTNGEKKIEKIYENLNLTIECHTFNKPNNSIQKTIQIKIKGLDENKIGKVITLPKSGGEEPEVVVEVTDKTAKLKGRLESALNDSGNFYGYFRISKAKLAPLFCNDIFGSNMIAVQANTKGGKITPGVEFTGSIGTLEPDTDYTYCAMVSNHPTNPTEIEYGQVVRFRTNPCITCPHTTVRTLNPIKVTSNSAVLRGNYNSTRNIKIWFEYKPKWGNEVPTELDGPGQTFLYPNIFKNTILGLNAFQSSYLSFKSFKNFVIQDILRAGENITPLDWTVIKDSEEILNKKRNYGSKQFTLTGLSF